MGTVVFFLIIIIFFLLAIISSQYSSSQSSSSQEDFDPPVYHRPRNSGKKTWEKNHFINKHLHRDDEKHERHRRNQYPW